MRLTRRCSGLAFAGMLGLRPRGQLLPAAERRVVRPRGNFLRLVTLALAAASAITPDIGVSLATERKGGRVDTLAVLHHGPTACGAALGRKVGEVLRRCNLVLVVGKIELDDTMGLGQERRFSGDGISFDVHRSPDETDFSVYQVEVTGPAVELSNGLRIGMKESDLLAVLGSPASADRAEGLVKLYFSLSLTDGWMTAEFHAGRLVRLSWGEDWS